MALFRNRQQIPPPRETIQKDYDNGIDIDNLQQKIITLDETISAINEGLILHSNLVDMMGETLITDIMLTRIRQKMIDFQQFILELEDDRVRVNYIDALMAVQGQIKRKQLFDSIIQQRINLPPEGQTASIRQPTIYETINRIISVTDKEMIETTTNVNEMTTSTDKEIIEATTSVK